MKRYGTGHRMLAMLLVLVMALSWLPDPARAAAVGDIMADSSGLIGDVDGTDTISWPIRIYDYLGDGMLFDFSSATDYTIYAHNGGSYGGGQPMPMIGGICGVDYTSVAGYYNVSDSVTGTNTYTPRYAFLNWGSSSGYSANYDASVEGATEVERSILQPVKDADPMCLHLEYDDITGAATKAYGWVSNFAKDDTQYHSKEDLRYLVMVYRTNDQYEINGGHTMKAYWAVSDSAYSSDADISDVTDSMGWNNTGTMVSGDVAVEPSSQWTYVVLDMKSNTSDAYGIAANWDLIEDERIAGVGMGLPLCGAGEAMDISHIAYFSSSEEATYFGQKCVRFDEDPGEYLGYTIGMTHSVSGGTVTSAISAPTVTKGLDLTKTVANGGSWNDTAVTRWSTNGLVVQDLMSHGSDGHCYARISEPDTILDSAYVKYGSTYYNMDDYRYVTLVYRTNITDPKVGFWVEEGSYYAGKGFNGTTYADKRVPIERSVDQWQTLVYDLAQINEWDTDYGAYFAGDTFDSIGIMFPGFTDSSQYMDIAYVKFDSNASDAEYFANRAEQYLNGFTVSGGNSVTTTLTKSDTTVVSSMWNMGNNQAFSLLYASTGGGWNESNYTAGGANSWTNGYQSYQIGQCYFPSTTIDNYRREAEALGYPVSDSIYLLNTYMASDEQLDMSQLDLGYTLYNTMKGQGVMTAGLLESGLSSWTGVDGKAYTVPVYKGDTVSYLAYLLRDSLTIPERDGYGYNYNYVMGTPSPQFCEDVDGDGKLDLSEDLDGDGKLDRAEDLDGDGVLDPGEDLDADAVLDVDEDLDGDGVLDVDEDINGNGVLDECTLAEALRQQLGIVFTQEHLAATNVTDARDQPNMADIGSYEDTLQRNIRDGQNALVGPFLMCKDNIQTFYDAAYYLLHDLFVPGSYNQPREDYEALVLSAATLEDGTRCYIFDSAFTTEDGQSATVFDKEQRVIYQEAVASKHQYWYHSSYYTALCPFLPIEPAQTGPYAVTGTCYVRDDGAESVSGKGDSYAGRNYSFVLNASGEFTFNSEVDQRLELAGDDDMYLFVNGELVMDVGAAHAITNVECVIGEYVNAAWNALTEALPGYELGMSDEDFETLLERSGIGDVQAQELRRHHKLCLVDGQSYPIEFYYMERRAWGSNLRIASNFQIRAVEEEEHVHDYVDGVCTGCGAQEPATTGKVLYFFNANGWAEPYVYAWNADSSTELMSWPGVPMELVSGTTDLYHVTVSEDATHVIFNDNGASPTEDNAIPTDGRNLYDNGGWYTFDEGEGEAVASGTCGDELEWVLYTNGTLEIMGVGDMDMFTDMEAQPWAAYRDQIMLVSISETVTSIGSYAFSNCTQLEEVIIPDAVTSIGVSAFEMCGSLACVTLPTGLTSIEDGTFNSCGALREVIIPAGVESIGADAFGMCWQMQQIDLPLGLQTIDSGAFVECTGLTEVLLPETLTSIGSFAFCGCTSLTKIQIPGGVTEVGVSAFAYCENLSTAQLTEGVTTIADSAFAGCGALTKVTLPESLVLVSEGAFESTGLVTVEYAGSEELWAQIQIEANNDPLTQAQIVFEAIAQTLNKLYYDDSTTNWGTVYVYYWNDSDDSMIYWPGEPMTDEGDGIFSCDVPAEAQYVIFNDGQGQQTPDMKIPGTGFTYSNGQWVTDCVHDYVDGVCTQCGHVMETYLKVYYDDSTTNWGTVYVYFWGDAGTQLTLWPGELMTDEGNGIFSYDVPGEAQYVIFNNYEATGEKTLDLTIPGTDYIYRNEAWEPYCAHSYGAGQITTQPGCETEGVMTYTCTLCGGSYTEPLPSIGHSYESVRTEPSCTEAGSDVYTCSVCGDSYTETILAHGHFYVCELSEVYCDKEGRAVYVCHHCADSYEESVSPKGHSYTSVRTEPSCDTEGSLVYTCENCGDSYSESIPALEHGYVSQRTEPSCETEGSLVYTCESCGHSYTESIPATGHSYANGVCGSCGAADPDWVVDPGLVLSHPTLSFEDEIIYNVYYTVADMTSVVEMGLMTLSSRDDSATIDDAIGIVPGYVTNGVMYLVKSEGIPAANIGDALYFKVYAKLTDGSYVYSAAGGYNAKAYANSILSGSYTDAMKSLVVSMLNYGAEAQLYFGHKTDSLVSSALTEEQKAFVSSYDSTMMDAIVKADTTKTTDFVRVSSNFKQLYPSVSFDGAFAINFYCTPAITVDSGMKLYYWDMETMDAVEKLSIENATGSMDMTEAGGIWWGQVPGIAAKQMDKTYYVTCVFESEGETITTGIISYSLGKYCSDKAAADGDAQQSFAQATAVYGYYAKQYFASVA